MQKIIEIDGDIDEFMIFIKSIYNDNTTGMSFIDPIDQDLAYRSCKLGLLKDVSDNFEAYLPTDIAKLLYRF
jgi:hypothetical protein